MGNPKRSRFGGFDPQTGLVGRTHLRTMGCWSCLHNAPERAKEIWKERRQGELQKALGIALQSPMGENDPKCENIKSLVNGIDHGLASGDLTHCKGPGVDANDNPVGTFVKSSYLCRQWSAAQGASVAREGERADDLPMELEDKDPRN